MAYKHLKVIFNVKAILGEEQQSYYLTQSWGNKGVHAFPKHINLKVKVIARPEFEQAYCKASIQHFSHCATGTPLNVIEYYIPTP